MEGHDAETTQTGTAERQLRCRDGGFLVQVDERDGSADCPACGWCDEAPQRVRKDAGGLLRGAIRPHKPLPVLILVQERDGSRRHYLDEKPLFCGSTIELRWWTGADCRWLPVRYESSLEGPRPSVQLFVTLPDREGREVRARILYSRELAVRWPARSPQDDQIPRYVDKLACPSCDSRRNPCGCGLREVRNG